MHSIPPALQLVRDVPVNCPVERSWRRADVPEARKAVNFLLEQGMNKVAERLEKMAPKAAGSGVPQLTDDLSLSDDDPFEYTPADALHRDER